MTLDSLIDQIEETGDSRSVLRPHRGKDGLCDAFFTRLLKVYACDPARAARLSAHWRAFRDLGDDPALAYRAKGFADRCDGRWMASAQAFLRAGELAKDETSRSAYSIGAIESLAHAGRIDEAVELGQRLVRDLDHRQESVLAAGARLNMANALLCIDDGTRAAALLKKAIPVFEREELALEEASCRLGLSTVNLHGGHPTFATEHAEAGRLLADRSGHSFVANLFEFNLASAAYVQGRADEAFARFIALRPRLADHPAEVVRTDVAIGDVCLRLNLFDEAAEAYRAALAGQGLLGATDRAYVLFGLGEALATSRPEDADRYLSQAANRWRLLGNHPWQSAALAARASLRPHSRIALRHSDHAIARSVGSPYHQTLAHLARAEAYAIRGVDPKADLAKAEKLARRYGYRRFAWKIHALRARTAKSSLPHYRKMFAEIVRERLATSSVAARTGFLKDKSVALGEYLATLLAKPTPSRVAEAREAIRQTRAATLLDEIVQSGSLKLDAEQTRRVEELRTLVAKDASEESVPDARSGQVHTAPRRAWTEATHVLGALGEVVPTALKEECVVLVEAGGDLWAIVGERSIRLGMNARDLEEALRWLRLEIQAPTADPRAPSGEALALLVALRKALVEPWHPQMGGRRIRLCPDGLLWRVPWNALFEEDSAITLLLHPSLSGVHKAGTLGRVAIWIDAAADLPNAIAEELTVLARFPDAMVFRSRAEILASMVEDWDLVHVVGHARHNAGNPMFSSLDFPDGPLYAVEIARSGLKTRLACLSACETGTLSFDAREEPDGLVRAFLARGAEAVLASLWPLDDAAASRFFSSLYGSIGPDIDLANAVHTARACVRSWRDHPYYWAPLTLFGGYQT